MVDIAAFNNDLENDLKAGREAFEGKYKAEINELLGLSREEIDKIIPGTTDLQVYDQLMVIVKQASRHNISQAELASNIKALGDIAVTIAQKSAKLAALI